MFTNEIVMAGPYTQMLREEVETYSAIKQELAVLADAFKVSLLLLRCGCTQKGGERGEKVCRQSPIQE